MFFSQAGMDEMHPPTCAVHHPSPAASIYRPQCGLLLGYASQRWSLGCGRKSASRTGFDALASLPFPTPAPLPIGGSNPPLTKERGRTFRLVPNFLCGRLTMPSFRPPTFAVPPPISRGLHLSPAVRAPAWLRLAEMEPRLRAEIRCANRLRRSRVSAFSYSRAIADRKFESSRAKRPKRGPKDPLFWSAREDSNLRPHPPQGCALPGCATRREPFTLWVAAQWVKEAFESGWVRSGTPAACRADDAVPSRPLRWPRAFPSVKLPG